MTILIGWQSVFFTKTNQATKLQNWKTKACC